MKKILVLSMTCNADFFTEEELVVRDTWAKCILNGEIPGMDYYSYTTSTDGKYHINYNEHRIYIPCDDSLNGTAEKTMKCFKLLEHAGIKYDYIFRTNTSTYINAKLLRTFVDTIYNNEIIYTGNTAVSFIDVGPYLYCECFGGNCVLLSRQIIDIMTTKSVIEKAISMDTGTETGNRMSLHPNAIYCIDDNCFSFIYNSYLISNKKNHMKYYSKFGIIGNDSYIDFDPFTKKCIAISVRFVEREGEMDFYRSIHNKIKELCDADEKRTTDLSDIYEIINDNKSTLLIYRHALHHPERIYMAHEDILNEFKKEDIKIPYTTDI